ncbi:lipoprotein [Streptomyces inusitatus]|uniref:Lipoprotein n=1 Tax=Streptomyces inusitatus TaxID=68221 RepID=A0A918QL17_9ACTN|nr:DUF461 domain-containing protein [Streptomyces inusitatus]GGZ57877.1 lipoprotein [Streptomyces inusitatus]
MSLPQTPPGGVLRLRRGALAVTAVALSFTALTACGAGNNAQSLGIKPDTAEATVDKIIIQNANVITQPEAGAAGPAVVSATVFNSGQKDQTIESVTLAGGAGTVKLTPAKGSGPITVPALGSVVIGGKGNATAVIEDGTALTGNIGGIQETVFRLSDTGDVKLKAFVVPSTEYFEEFGPSSLPTPAAPAPKASGSPSESASGAPGSEATDQASDAASDSASDAPADSASDSASQPAS